MAVIRSFSYLVLLLAVALPSIVLFVFNDKDLARITFVAVLVIGYSAIFFRWRLTR